MMEYYTTLITFLKLLAECETITLLSGWLPLDLVQIGLQFESSLNTLWIGVHWEIEIKGNGNKGTEQIIVSILCNVVPCFSCRTTLIF